jgi:hypothetical protein
MAWEVIDCGVTRYPGDEPIKGWIYGAWLENTETGEDLEFELLDGVYYGEEDEYRSKPLNIIMVYINGKIDFEEVFPDRDKARVMRELKRLYGDILQAMKKECDDFDLKL